MNSQRPNIVSHNIRYNSIPFLTLAYIAWRNLINKKLRTFLTVFGVVIGIGAICFLLSFGIGLRELVTKEVIGGKSVNSIEVTSPNSTIIKLDNKNVQRIAALPRVSQVGLSYSFAGALSYDSSEIDSVVYGVDTNFQKLSNISTSRGRLIDNKDTNVALINKTALQAIGIKNSKDILEKTVTIRVPFTSSQSSKKAVDQVFQVIGVVDSGKGAEVFIPNFVFENAGVTAYSQIKIVADKSDRIQYLRKQIESIGFETSSPIDTIEQINQVFRFFTIMLVGFGAIGMIVAILGMFNTLTISLLERTKELGLMVALGGRNRDMKKLFTIEAVVLSVIGSVTGIFIAMIYAFIVNIIMNNMAQSRGVTESFTLFAFPPWLIMGLIVFMILVGLMVVYFPAKRAEKIDPIDVLRRE